MSESTLDHALRVVREELAKNDNAAWKQLLEAVEIKLAGATNPTTHHRMLAVQVLALAFRGVPT